MSTEKRGRSRTGIILMSLYLIAGCILFYEAYTCTGFLCDLVALPVVFPLGFPIAWITDGIDYMFQIPGHVPTFHFRNWYFIVPTLLANTFFYYWLGRFSEKTVRRVRNYFNRSTNLDK
jgi:hypothetical protein